MSSRSRNCRKSRCSGHADYEIAIEVSEARLREYNLTFDQVVNVVYRSNLNLAGGTIRSQGERDPRTDRRS